MFNFWLRFLAFCLLWGLMIYQGAENIAISILFFAVACAIFFFLSLRTSKLFISLSLSLVILIHDLAVANESTYSFLLLLFVTIVAAYYLKEKQFMIYLSVNVGLSFVICFLYGKNVIEFLSITVFFYFIVLSLNNISKVRDEQKEIYEQLLGEYRRLKRMNIKSEQDARHAERTKIARDIHDSVGHRLTALSMKLEMLAIQNTDTDYRELKQMAAISLEETRQAVKALQTEETEGLATVVHLIRKLEAESHILVQFTMKQGIMSVSLSNVLSIVLYRVIQEALTNAMRHAQSREVQVILGKSATGAIFFEVRNRIYAKETFEFGFGLTNMKKRLEEISGNLEVYQTEKQFIVSGTIPVE